MGAGISAVMIAVGPFPMRQGPAHSEFIKSNTKQREAFRTGGALRALYSMTGYTVDPQKFHTGTRKWQTKKMR
jgi:hypothetical protein